MAFVRDAVAGLVSGALTSLWAPVQAWLDDRAKKRAAQNEMSVVEQAKVIKGAEDARKTDDQIAALDDAGDLAELHRIREAAARRK